VRPFPGASCFFLVGFAVPFRLADRRFVRIGRGHIAPSALLFPSQRSSFLGVQARRYRAQRSLRCSIVVQRPRFVMTGDFRKVVSESELIRSVLAGRMAIRPLCFPHSFSSGLLPDLRQIDSLFGVGCSFVRYASSLQLYLIFFLRQNTFFVSQRNQKLPLVLTHLPVPPSNPIFHTGPFRQG